MPRSTAVLWTALFACSAASADTRPDSHAPIGVMGDHTHKAGELMFSYRLMHMAMENNGDGSDGLSAGEIATTVPNRFFGAPMQPPTLRVVPTEMTMDMHMVGVMYAPTDRVTLMGMTSYVEKDMDHLTFAGPAGDAVLGTFNTSTSGFGDTSLSALISLGSLSRHRWHATVGVSVPTGDLDETGAVLTPMNTQPTLRLPYPMQLGSGSYDAILGLTYASDRGRVGWGGQWRSVIRLEDNDEGYRLGNEHQLTAWSSYRLHRRLSGSARLSYTDRGNVDGMDSNIMAPVQTADPSRQSLERLELGLGVNLVLPGDRQRLALEASRPLLQDLDGPQLEADWQATLGWQFAF